MLKPYLEQICQSLDDAICITDRNGLVVFVNNHYSKLANIAKETMLNRHVQEMVQSGMYDIVLNPQIVITGENATGIQNVFNGRKLYLNGNPIKDTNGRVAYVLTVVKDYSQLSKELNENFSQNDISDAFNSVYIERNFCCYPFIMNSKIMQSLYYKASSAALTDATVLLLGETGTGKDVIARYIHSCSNRAQRPFIKVDCGSIPENLIESELFGYMPGSFSGANRRGKIGLIEAASSGTLFLDEIGELPLQMQGKLLRTLQDREIMKLGAIKPKKIDIRIIAATNKNLLKEVKLGNFRSDLYYRLNVVTITIPPLRNHKEDILPLANHFLGYYRKKYNKEMYFSHNFEKFIVKNKWNGNIRELENYIHGIIASNNANIIEPENLEIKHNNIETKLLTLNSFDGKTYKEIMKDLKTIVLREGIKKYGSIKELAKQFKIDMSTIYRELKANK